MSEIRGRVGAIELSWLGAPRGARGTLRVRVKGAAEVPDGTVLEVRWRRDQDGLWMELPHGSFGYDFEGEPGDDGRLRYRVSERYGAGEWAGQFFLRDGDETTSASAATARKGLRVRAQMPGKILRILVRAGEPVSKGQPLLVMEAMKMENEIKALAPAVVRECKVAEGQAIESGADLLLLDPV
jgi:hypothetical protein